MAKHIKRFSTYDEYVDYVSDSSFEPPLVSVCDEITEYNEGTPSANFVLNTDIKISNPENYMGIIYVTDEHEVLYSYNIGPILRATNNSPILGESQDTYEKIPYHKNLYYCWELHSLGGYDYTTVSNWEQEYEITGQINVNETDIIGYSSFWDNYCSSKSISSWSDPYNITGYPGDYNYPTLNMNAGENKYTSNYPDTVHEGDEVQVPILEGFKLAPGATLNIYTPAPK